MSSENDEKNTPEANGITALKINVRCGTPVMNSTPRDSEIIKGTAYNSTPTVIPVITCFNLTFKNDNPQNASPLF